MISKNTNDAAENQKSTQAGDVHFTIQRIYVKDLSFESPLAPKVFSSAEWKPEVNIELSVQHNVIETHIYEVVLVVTVTLIYNKQTILILEVKQAGIFSVEGVQGEQLDHLLGSYCPNILFPYVREVISEVISRGGFPQLLLAPVNFDALYEQSKKKVAENS